jgi:hypothetical protein
MEDYTITELSYSTIAMLGGVSGLLLVIWKSRCKEIRCCWGGMECEREVMGVETAFQGNEMERGVETAEL